MSLWCSKTSGSNVTFFLRINHDPPRVLDIEMLPYLLCLVVVIISSMFFSQSTEITLEMLLVLHWFLSCFHVVIRIYSLSVRRPKRLSVSQMSFLLLCLQFPWQFSLNTHLLLACLYAYHTLSLLLIYEMKLLWKNRPLHLNYQIHCW